MKVNFPSSLGGYYKAGPSASAGKSTKASSAAKTDVAEFSRGQASALDKALAGAKASIQSNVSAPGDPARVAALTQSVREGTYHVSTDDIVKAILDS